MLFPIDHGNSAMKTVNFVFPSGLIDNPIRPPVDTEMLEYPRAPHHPAAGGAGDYFRKGAQLRL